MLQRVAGPCSYTHFGHVRQFVHKKRQQQGGVVLLSHWGGRPRIWGKLVDAKTKGAGRYDLPPKFFLGNVTIGGGAV